MAATLAVLPHLDDAHRHRLTEEIPFNFAHPAAYQAVWGRLIDLIPATDKKAAILIRARSDSELHVNNALRLPYYIYGRVPHFPLSDQGRAELEDIVADLGASTELNALMMLDLGGCKNPSVRERAGLTSPVSKHVRRALKR
jgi:hypothetical protein